MIMSTRVVCIVQARSGSTRLPQKVLHPLVGKPMLLRQLERIGAAKTLDAIVVATTDKPEDDAVESLAKEAGVLYFRGSEQDVLDRYYQAAKEAAADVVVRITGDCPLHDPQVIDLVVKHFDEAKGAIDYTGTPVNYPEGFDTEVFSFAALEAAWKEARLPSEREHVTPYIKNHPEQFTCDSWNDGDEDNSKLHFSVDTEADFRLAEQVFERLGTEDTLFSMRDILALVKVHPELLEINKGGTGYEGLAKSLKEDETFLKNI